MGVSHVKEADPMKRKSIGLKILTAGMTAVLALQTPMMTLRASAASAQYISEVILSYGKTDEEAKNWLTQNGYKVVGQNLNEGGEGGSDAFSWLGLASEKRSVFLGYKTTTDPNDAITDMKIMNMNGGYSYEAYEKVLADTAAEKEHFLQNIMAALSEYRENYRNGAVKAKIAHDNLNKFRDDDSGALMGDLLLNTLKTEDEAAWEADPTQHADMVTILMQGNSTCVSEIMQNLAIAADTSDSSFVSRTVAGGSRDRSKTNFDVFFEAFLEKRPEYTRDDAATELMRLYDDDAKMFASSLIGLRNYLSNYTNSGLSVYAEKEEAEAYFAEHPLENATTWAGAANLFAMLSQIHYGDWSLINYLVYNDDDYLTNASWLDGYKEFSLPKRAKLYPFIAEMSAGQRALLEYTSMDKLLTVGLMDADTWGTTYATVQDSKFGVTDFEPCSVYAMVNRNDFKVGEIAVTNMAQGRQASVGEPMDEGLFGIGVSYLTAGIFAGGIVTTVAGAAIAAKNWTADGLHLFGNPDRLRESVLSRCSLESYIEDYTILNHGDLVMESIMASPDELYTALNSLNRNLATVAGLSQAVNFGDASKAISQFNDASEQYIKQFCNVAGPDANFAYAKFMPQVDNETGTIKFSNGQTWNMKTGAVTRDLNADYTEEIKDYHPNPDIKAAANQAKEQLDDLAAAAGQNVDEVTKQAVDKWDDMGMAVLMSERTEDYFSEFLRVKEMNPDLSLNSLSQKQFDDFANYMKDTYPNSTAYAKIKDVQEHNVKAIIDVDNANKDGWEIVDKMDDIAEGGEEAADKVNDAAEAAMTSGSGSTFWMWFGVGMAIVGLIMSAYSVYAAISEMKAYYHQEMLPIPRRMVDLGYLADGTTCYIYYDCAKCNRTAMNMGNEILGDYGDLNGDVMKQWLALYTAKDSCAGKPILASITVKKGTTSIPMKTVPLSFFGFNSAVNMTDTRFTYNNAKNGIYLYYKQAAASYAGTAATGGLYVTVGVLSAIGGAGICGLAAALLGRRRKKDEQPAETKAA